MSVLIDTSVWVDHFRRRNEHLGALLAHDLVLTHPMVLLEIACGTPPARKQTLADLGLLANSEQATVAEVTDFVEREALFGLGCGLVDLTLLASALVTPGAQLWTSDRRLAALAMRFGIGYGARRVH